MEIPTESSKTLLRARLQALSVPLLYAVFGCAWILVSDLVLEAMQLPPHVSTRIAMVKGWIYVAGSTVLIAVVMRTAWSTLEKAYAELQTELGERRKAQEAMARLNEELEARVAERTRHLQEALSELAMFSDSVSHDLRSPLRVVSGYAQVLEESQASVMSTEGRDCLGRLKAAAGRMDRMIHGLMELSRHGRAALRIVDFDPVEHENLVDEIWREIELGEPGRSFELTRGGFPRVRCDPRLLEHVWRNLLSNAAKYTRGRNPVVIGIEFRDGWFRVKDNGTGFDPAQASRVFKPFERLHRSEDFDGDGIGLALVARVIERHGGEVRAEGLPGVGSEFGFRLPMGDDDS